MNTSWCKSRQNAQNPAKSILVARKSPTNPPPPPPAEPAGDTLVDRAQDEVAEVMGDIAEFWGFTRTMGRIFGFVYMSPEAVDQATVRTRLSISAGSASTTMTALLDWGVLRREGRFYVAETNFFKLITAVLRQREAARVDAGIDRARAVLELLRQGHADDPRVAFARQRAEHMLGFFEMGRAFLEAFVERSPIRAILNGLARTASRLRPAALPDSKLAHDFDITLDESDDDDREQHDRIDA
jgi:DNA-binding transcriptional regulator GbsR (MarR family)